MKRNLKSILLLSTGLAFTGCYTIVDYAVINSSLLETTGPRYVRSYGLETDIHPVYEGEINLEDRLLLLIHGFAGNRDSWGSEDNDDSPLNIAKSYYGDNIIIAEYGSDQNISTVAERLDEIVRDTNHENIDIVAHSQGGLIARKMVRDSPEKYNSVGLVAIPHSGMDVGVFTNIMRRRTPYYLDSALEDQSLVPEMDDYGAMQELFPGSDIFEKINTPSDLGNHRPTYHFFIFSAEGGTTRYIPGDDDSLLSPRTADPTDLIEEGMFEDVDAYSLIRFKGEIDHVDSLHNPAVMGKIVDIVRNYTERDRTFADPDDVYVESHDNERSYMNRIENP